MKIHHPYGVSSCSQPQGSANTQKYTPYRCIFVCWRWGAQHVSMLRSKAVEGQGKWAGRGSKCEKGAGRWQEAPPSRILSEGGC